MTAAVHRISTRNSRFQVWQALLSNRNKRQRQGLFLVQGVRPITLAVAHGWAIDALLLEYGRPLSSWALDIMERADGDRFALSRELLAELGEKGDDAPELIAVVALPGDDLDRLNAAPDFLGVLVDRPTNPGNLGSIIRSADAFGAHGVLVSGHAADPYDSAAVRASTGSLFGIPTMRVPSPAAVLEWVAAQRDAGIPVQLVATDETGDADVFDTDLTRPTLLLIGNETSGLSAAWREAADVTVRIPITGSASSLNAANAASIVLYEAARQRLLAIR